MITTVFFDLDGTLLPMDPRAFLSDYLGRMTRAMASYGYDAQQLTQGIWAGIDAMVKNNSARLNEDVFWEAFSAFLHRNTLADKAHFEEFYRVEFQQVQKACGFNPQAAETVRQIRAAGYETVLATNPMFPPIATQSRVRWAGLTPEDFAYITTYDNSTRCKPNPDYFRELLDKLHLQAPQCLMVGNDVQEDMVAQEVGMQVFLLTDCIINRDERDISIYPHGSFPELRDYLRV